MFEPAQASVRSDESEAGFSLIEALVVLAISSLLLVVLTDTLVASQRGHQRLEDHFERRGEAFYLDLQMQAVIDNIYVDPLLHPTGWQPAINDRNARLMSTEQWRQRHHDPVFVGETDQVSGEFRNVLSRRGAVEPFELSWIDSQAGRQIQMVAGEMTVTWPRYFPRSTQFHYATDSGQLVTRWPVVSNARSRPAQANPALTPLPDAIHLFDTAQSLTLAVYDVPE